MCAYRERATEASGTEPRKDRRATVHVIGLRGVPASWGGVERQVEELYSRLAARGYRVVVYGRSHYVPTDVSEYKGMIVKRLPTIEVKGFESAIHSLLAVFCCLMGDPQIVHFYTQGACLFSWIPRILRPKARVFFTCVGLDWQRKKWAPWQAAIIRLGEVCSVLFPHCATAVSRELQTYYQQHYGISLHHVPNGVNLPAPDSSSCRLLQELGLKRRDYFLWVGRIVPEKRLEDLIEAFKTGPIPQKLVIVGGSDHTQSYFTKLRKSAGNASGVVFAGFRYGSELDQLFRNARGFVTASELEGLPLTLLEAMSYGLVCIASDIAPHREALGGLGEFVFPVGGVNRLNQHLLHVGKLGDEALDARHFRAVEWVRAYFSWDEAADRLDSLYRQSLASGADAGAANLPGMGSAG